MEETQFILADAPPIPNWDYKRCYFDEETFASFVPFPVLLPEGTLTYYFPAKWVNHPNPKKRKKLIQRALDQARRVDEANKPSPYRRKIPIDITMGFVSALANQASDKVYENLFCIMEALFFRALQTNRYLIALQVVHPDEDNIPDFLKDDPEQVRFHYILARKLREKLRPHMDARILNSNIIESSERQYQLFILQAIERDYGPMERMDFFMARRVRNSYSEDTVAKQVPLKLFAEQQHGFRSCLEPVMEGTVATYLALTLSAGELARDYLEELNPASWSFEQVAEFLDLELAYDLVEELQTPKPISVKKDRAGRVMKRLLDVTKLDPNLTWNDEGDSVSFQFTLRVDDLSRVNMADLADYAKGVKELRGGKRNVKVADLSEETRRALGKRYVELLNELKQIKKEAKILATFNTAWQGKIVKKYQVLKNYADLIDGLDLIGEVDTWQVCIEIAARETIPGYQQWEKKPTPNTSRTAAILPGQAA
jgi:hypothetical protein